MISFFGFLLSFVYFYEDCSSICKHTNNICKQEPTWKYNCPIANNFVYDGFLRCEGLSGPVYTPNDICDAQHMFVQEFASDNRKENYSIFCCEHQS